MKIFVTGAAGQVGSEIMDCGKRAKYNMFGFTKAELDITDFSKTNQIISEVNPDIIINASAYTAVDRAESNHDLAFAVNCDGPRYLAEISEKRSIPLFHISTDYIFDGTKNEAYQENDPVNPLSVYGRSKQEGEAILRASCSKHIILRTSWVFGQVGHNFVKSVIRLSKEREHLNMVSDQKGGPTEARDIALALLSIAENIKLGGETWGTYHFSGAPAVNWYEFATSIISEVGRYQNKQVKVKPITTDEYPTPAIRPLNSVLDNTKIQSTFNISQPLWEVALKRVVKSLLSEEYENA